MNKDEKIFITGATGFIGTTLVRQLVGEGYSLHTLSRSKPTLPPAGTDTPDDLWDSPQITHFRGDVCDPDSIRKAMQGCRRVIHLAGYAKNYARDIAAYTRINIEGMRNVFTVAMEQNIEKIVWTSTIVTLGPTRKGVVGDETMERITEKYLTEYERTKTIAEREAYEWVHKGLPLVIVNPTRVYGPGQLSEGNALALLVQDYMKGRLPFLLNAGVNVGNYVLVDDLARGIFLALEKGSVGQRYILGGDNATLREFFRIIDRVTGKKHWQVPVFRPGAMIFAHIQLLIAKCLGTYPRITPGWMRTFLTDWAFSIDKAKNELGYHSCSLEEGLKKTCRWIDQLNQ